MYYASLLLALTLQIFISTAPPLLFVEHPHYDHGIVEESEPLQTDFVFFNGGHSMLEITGLKTDCGCTLADLSQSEIPPGSSGVISVVFTPRGRPGIQMTRIDVASNDPKRRPFFPCLYLANPRSGI